jgi:hypothetical protein
MALVDILKLVKFDEMSDEQRRNWTKELRQRKREIEAALTLVDRGLTQLSKKPKRKTASRRHR